MIREIGKINSPPNQAIARYQFDINSILHLNFNIDISSLPIKFDGNYQVVQLCFSPDSARLAVAQSDGSVFVYKLGVEWGEKKSIVNKFVQPASVTCLTWPKEQFNSIVFGSADGRVRIGNLKTNKPSDLYQDGSAVVVLTSSPDGQAIASGHLDGSINRYWFTDVPESNQVLHLIIHSLKGPIFGAFLHPVCVGVEWRLDRGGWE